MKNAQGRNTAGRMNSHVTIVTRNTKTVTTVRISHAIERLNINAPISPNTRHTRLKMSQFFPLIISTTYAETIDQDEHSDDSNKDALEYRPQDSHFNASIGDRLPP